MRRPLGVGLALALGAGAARAEDQVAFFAGLSDPMKLAMLAQGVESVGRRCDVPLRFYSAGTLKDGATVWDVQCGLQGAGSKAFVYRVEVPVASAERVTVLDCDVMEKISALRGEGFACFQPVPRPLRPDPAPVPRGSPKRQT